MATTAPSDPYKILGVDSSADAPAIKKAYRKLVLSCHPDKVTDESLKAQKQEEFHQIQQAYETIGDPEARTRYDLEIKAKKLREERDRAASKGSTTQYRNVNINIHTATHPSEYRSSSSRHTPAKPASYKPYSAEFSKSCEHDIPNRSRAYQDEKKTRRVYSDERLNDDRKRREEERERERDRERERERAHRRRQQEEDDERRRRQLKREKEERELRERQRVKEAAKRREREREREREQQEQERIRAELKAEKKARERAELRRKQEAAEEKLRAKTRSQEHTSEEDDDRKSRSKKSSKKESPRDKTPSKYRERSGPREESIPEVPSTADQLESKMAYAALYIRGQQAKKSSKSSSKHTADAPLYSDAYPDPEQWKPKRRVSGEKSKAAAEPIIVDAGSPPMSPIAQPTHPRLSKSYTTGHVPGTSDPRPSFSRAQTYDQEAFARSMGGERPRMSRQRTSLENDDYYTPRVQKYTVRPDRTVYESPLRDPYMAPSGAFPKVKTAQAYGPEVVNHSKRYDPNDLAFADYSTAHQQPYVAT